MIQTLNKLEAFNRFAAQEKIRVVAAAVKEPPRRPMQRRPATGPQALSRRLTNPQGAPTAPMAQMQGGPNDAGRRQSMQGNMNRRMSTGRDVEMSQGVAPIANMVASDENTGRRQQVGSTIDTSRDPRNRR